MSRYDSDGSTVGAAERPDESLRLRWFHSASAEGPNESLRLNWFRSGRAEGEKALAGSPSFETIGARSSRRRPPSWGSRCPRLGFTDGSRSEPFAGRSRPPAPRPPVGKALPPAPAERDGRLFPRGRSANYGRCRAAGRRRSVRILRTG